jgi:two-component system chemotaxis sensor kinase CheA
LDIAQYIGLYADASDEHLRALSRNLLTLETDPDDQPTIHEVFRSAHTLKGMSATMGFDQIADLTHQMEGALDLVRSGKLRADGSLVGLLLACVDVLQEMVQQAISGRAVTTDTTELRKRLAAVRGFPADPTRAAAAPGSMVEALPRPPAAPTVPDARVAAGQVPHTLRVDTDKLDDLMNLTGELAIAQVRLGEISRRYALPELADTAQGIGRITGNLQAVVMTARMCLIGQVLSRFPRMVQDLARSSGKEVDFVIHGADTAVDRTLADEMSYLLVHLVRNAVDHGIEAPAERADAGKAPQGHIALEATREGDSVSVVVRDDGAGIDARQVRKRAVSQGLITEGEASALTDREAVEIAFMPGFSTVENATVVSGRGVGLDVVRSKVMALGGSLEVRTAKGEGTVFSVRLPAVLTPVEALLVGVGDRQYAIPLAMTDETAAERPDKAVALPDGWELAPPGPPVPIVHLRSLLRSSDEPCEENADAPVVVLRSGRRRIVLVVDALLGRQHIIARPLPETLGSPPFVSAMAVLGDGSLALVLSAQQILTAIVA